MEDDKFRSKLSAYKDGELDRNFSEKISIHLRNCAVCKKELAEFEQVDSLVKEMPKLEISEPFSLQIISRLSAEKQDHPDFAPFSKRVFTKFLQLADSIFELVSGYEYEGDTLDEFSDFPPLSMGHAYFQVIGQRR